MTTAPLIRPRPPARITHWPEPTPIQPATRPDAGLQGSQHGVAVPAASPLAERLQAVARQSGPRAPRRPTAALPAVQHQQGMITVSRTAYGRTAERQESIQVEAFLTDPARVRVSGGVTRNLGDYNSARVEVMVELPCYATEVEIRAAYSYASELVDNMVGLELAQAVGA